MARKRLQYPSVSKVIQVPPVPPATPSGGYFSKFDLVQRPKLKQLDSFTNTVYLPAAVTPGLVIFDSQMTAPIVAAGATSFSDSTHMTVGTQLNRALLLMIHYFGSTGSVGGSPMTWNGVNMTLLNRAVQANFGCTTELWGLLNPASGANTLAGTWTSTASIIVSAASFYNVDQTSIVVSFNNGTTNGSGTTSPATTTISGNTGDMAVATYANSDGSGGFQTFTTISGNTVFNTTGTQLSAAGNYASNVGSSVVLSATETANEPWTVVGTNIKALAGSGASQTLIFGPKWSEGSFRSVAVGYD